MSRSALTVTLAALVLALAGCSHENPQITRDGSLSVIRQEASFGGGGSSKEILVVHDAETGRTWVVADKDAVVVVQSGGVR